MNHQQRSFIRKIIYLSAMAVLLVPLSLWGLPATPQAAQAAREAKKPKTFLETLQGGRVLANLRYQENLAQGSLGKVDPGSEVIRFGTLGFRGFTVAWLWRNANEYKKKEDWTSFKATLDKIKYLQPNFVNVWRFQGWNLSFNVSAEWEDYRYRYKYVVQGIKYLDEGQQFNDRETRLLWDESWYTGYKIGRADEYRQFRVLFRNQEMEDVPRPKGKIDIDPRGPDNWLWSKAGFREALDLHETKNVPLLGMGEEFYYSEPAKCHIRYTEANVEDGILGDFARLNWKKALDAWHVFGNQPFVSYMPGGKPNAKVRLNDLEAKRAEADKLIAQLDALGQAQLKPPAEEHAADKKTDERKKDKKQPDVKQNNVKKKKKPNTKQPTEKKKSTEKQDEEKKPKKKRTLRQQLEEAEIRRLRPEDRDLLNKKLEEIAEKDRERFFRVTQRITVSHMKVAQYLKGTERAKGIALAKQIEDLEDEISRIDGKRHMLNFTYWRTRCEAEGSDLGIKARELLRDARVSFGKDSASASTLEAYETAFKKWREVYDKYPILVGDGDVGDDLIAEFRLYADALDANGKSFDKKTFILKDVIEQRQPTPPIR